MVEAAVTRRALSLYGERTRLDFADAYLAAAAFEVGRDRLVRHRLRLGERPAPDLRLNRGAVSYERGVVAPLLRDRIADRVVDRERLARLIGRPEDPGQRAHMWLVWQKGQAGSTWIVPSRPTTPKSRTSRVSTRPPFRSAHAITAASAKSSRRSS